MGILSRRSMNICLLAVLSLLLLPVCSSAETVLVEDGRAACVIVTGEDDGLSRTHTMVFSNTTRSAPSEALRHAAEDLAGYLNEIGWIGEPRFRVPVVKNIEEARAPYRVLLGTAAIEEYGLRDEAAGLSFSGYIYRTAGRDLLIFGRTSKGTANGVYGFLQDELGVRWFGPQELFTVLPERKERIAVSGIDKRVEPSFWGHFGLANRAEEPVYPWRRRMRLAEAGDGHTRMGVEPFSSTSHHVQHIIPAGEYFDSNPEYFVKRGGQRWRHPSPGQQSLCWTNPEVIDIAVRAAKERFARGGHYHTFSIGIPDSDAYCECPDCVAIQPERYYRGRSPALQRVASDQYFHFVNEVAGRVAEEYPDRYLGIIAYNDVSLPPLGEVEPNVFVQVVLDVSEHFDGRVKEQDRELIEAWEEKGVTLGMYYYTGLAKLVPAYFPRYLSEVLKDIHSRGFRGLRAEVYPGWPWRGPMAYTDARLWWDVDLDIDELLEEYFEKLYGPAAPYVSELFDLFEEIHMRPRTGGFLYEHYNFAQFRPYTGEDFKRMEELLASAHEAIEEFGTDRFPMGRANPEERRLAYITNGLRFFMDMLEGVVLARELGAEEVTADYGSVISALSRVDRMLKLAGRHERVYRESITMDPYQSARYTWDTCTPVREQWKQYLSRVSGETLVEIYRMMDSGELNLGARVREMFNRVAGRYRAMSAENEALFMLGAGRWHLEGPNLARNPGFEETDEDGVPVNWGRTPADRRERGSLIDTVLHREPSERFGLRSGRMKGITGGAYYLAAVPGVEEGESYFVTVDAKLAADSESAARVFMQVSWFGPGGWIRGADVDFYSPDLRVRGEWGSMETVAIAPEGANRAQVFLRVESMLPPEEAWFDNLSVRKIGGR